MLEARLKYGFRDLPGEEIARTLRERSNQAN